MVDVFAKEAFSYSDLFYPVGLFLLAQIMLDVAWRISDVAERKCEPHVRQSIVLQVYDHVLHHSYQFFQNTQSGSIISKIKGVLDGYDNVFDNIHHTIGRYFCTILVMVLSLAVVSVPTALFMVCWCIVFSLAMSKMIKRLSLLTISMSDAKHEMFGLISDGITNIFNLFTFAARKKELKTTKQTIEHGFTKKQDIFYRHKIKFALVASIFFWFMLICILAFLVYARQNHIISVGDTVFILIIVLDVSYEIWALIWGISDFMIRMGDFKSAFSIMQIPNDNMDKADAKTLEI